MQTDPRADSATDVAADRADRTLLSLVEATTGKSGSDFLRYLVKHLALTLDVTYAFVAEFAGSPTRVRTIALWGGDRWLDNIEYELAGTPCEEVLAGATCMHADNVHTRFPLDVMLADIGARSFLGVPLRAANGDTLGHLAVIDTKPMVEERRFEAVFHLIADRARIELERLRADAALLRTNRDLASERDSAVRDLLLARDHLAALVELHRAIEGHLDRKALFASVAEALSRIVDFGRVIFLLPSADPATLTVFAAYGKSGIRFFEGESIPREGSIPGWVVEHGRPMIVERSSEIRDTFSFSHRRLQEEGMESVAVLPLVTGGRCVGALSLMAERAGAWASVPPALLEGVAAAVAVAVNSCVAYEELDHLREEQASALEVNRAVARHLQRDELFATLSHSFRGLLPFDRFGIELRVDSERLRTHLFSPSAQFSVAQIVELPAGGTACRWTEEHQRWLVMSSREEIRERFPVTFSVMQQEGMESLCTIPLAAEQRSLGVLFFMASARGAYRELRRGLLDRVAGSVAVALDNCLAYEEVRALRDRLARENVYLQEEIRQEHNFEEIVGRSRALLDVLSQVQRIAPTDSTALILGETGTGKELVARAIHDRSQRRTRPLIKVNCAAISAGLVESELFGHVKGAFTGAVSSRTGRFEAADRGTIFLDEIGELPPEAQVKLLRVLQEKEFEAVGSSHTRKVDVRVIAATNRDLGRAIESGTFRADLFYRLNVMPIRVPPLRERREDIPALVSYFLSRHARVMGKHIEGISREALARLTAYDWPGNIREVQNLVERAVILADGPIIDIGTELLSSGAQSVVSVQPSPRHTSGQPLHATSPAAGLANLEDVQRRHIETMLARSGWIIEGENGAARQLGLHPNTLRSRMKRLGVSRPRPTAS